MKYVGNFVKQFGYKEKEMGKDAVILIFVAVVRSLSCIHLIATPQTASFIPGFSVLHCLPEFVQTRVH